jgi:bacillithiol biosynthesis deacetylase BshB1
MPTVDILAIAAHRDDVELTCAGTLIKAVAAGRTTAVIDLTAGELGTRGSAELRGEEASRAAAVMGLSARENLELPDGGVTNTPETRARLAVAIRKFRPAIVIAPSLKGKHPDHTVSAQLIRDACFVAGLKKVQPDVPAFRPRKIVHCLAYREDYVKPTFVVDITEEFEKKMEAIRCYSSQFDDATQAGEVSPNGESLYEVIRHHAAHYGSLIRTRYGEPFYTTETMRVNDISALEVATF